MPRFIIATLVLGLASSFGLSASVAQQIEVKSDPHPISKQDRDKMQAEFKEQIAQATELIKATPDQESLYSRRGDAYFFSGEFDKSLADYEKMVELNADGGSSHWRRGIARFYAAKFKEAAHQFEIYNSFDDGNTVEQHLSTSFDDVDRENGIWRYFSQYKASGPKKAKEGLLKYKKDDREPFPSVYKLFSNELQGDAILKSIADADISDSEREKRYFYANLYVGLNHAVEGNGKLALPYLKASTANKWGPTAGYGPTWMWHVGRLHYELLEKAPAEKPTTKKAESF